MTKISVVLSDLNGTINILFYFDNFDVVIHFFRII